MEVNSLQKINIDVYNQAGEKTEVFELDKKFFGLHWNADLVYQVAVSMQANKRTPIAHAKDRGEVRGGGKKPWRQKGLGRARHGSIRSPIWIGGGVTHGPTKEKIYKKKINKKMKQKSLFVVLAQKLRDNEILFVDNLSLNESKTKKAAAVIKALRIINGYANLGKRAGRALFCLADSRNEFLAFRNLPYVNMIETRNLNTLDALQNKFIVLTKEGVKNLKITC